MTACMSMTSWSLFFFGQLFLVNTKAKSPPKPPVHSSIASTGKNSDKKNTKYYKTSPPLFCDRISFILKMSLKKTSTLSVIFAIFMAFFSQIGPSLALREISNRLSRPNPSLKRNKQSLKSNQGLSNQSIT